MPSNNGRKIEPTSLISHSKQLEEAGWAWAWAWAIDIAFFFAGQIPSSSDLGQCTELSNTASEQSAKLSEGSIDT